MWIVDVCLFVVLVCYLLLLFLCDCLLVFDVVRCVGGLLLFVAWCGSALFVVVVGYCCRILLSDVVVFF